MITKSTKTIANRMAALFFSCALAVSLLPAATFTAFADDAQASPVEAQAPEEEAEGQAEELEPEQAEATNETPAADDAQASEDTAPRSEPTVTPAAQDIRGFIDADGSPTTSSATATGLWEFDPQSKTLTIRTNASNPSATSVVLMGKPWRGSTLNESDVLKIDFVGKTILKQSTVKTFEGFSSVQNIYLRNVEAGQRFDASDMFKDLSNLIYVDLDGFKTTNVTNMSGMFSGCKILASINGLEKLSTVNVTNMSGMFQNCGFLSSLNLQGFNTSKVTDMSNMFSGCSALDSVIFSSNFITSNVTNMSGMFSGCKRLTSVDVSKFNTAKVENMNGMFRDCNILERLTLTSFNTANVGNMSEMFQGCSAIKSLALSSFNTSKVSGMVAMFRGCNSLETLTLSSNFKGTSLTDVNNMFADCRKLASIDLSSLDTPNVRDFTTMFQSCFNLSVINISALDTSKAKTWNMFDRCDSLEYLKVGKNFTFKGGVTPTNSDYKLGLPSGEWVSSASSLAPQSAASLLENPLNGTNGTTYFKTPINLANVTIAKPANATYTGKAITPKPSVTLGENGNALTEGVAFKYVYLSNIGAGKAYVGIEALDSNKSFKGSSRMIEFAIAPKSITGATVTIDPQPYTGDPREPNPKVVVDGTTLAKDTDYTVKYANNTKAGTATATITGKGNYTGTISKSFTISTSVPVPASEKQVMYRLYNPNSGEHFYTKDTNERNSLVKVGWRYEGTAWTAPVKSGTPVYRLYNPNAGDHHYTTSAGEKDHLVKVGWNYEGIGWYSETLKSVPVYRLYNPNAVTGTHHYTTSKAENDNLVRVGWRAEGVGWYGMK